MNSSIQACYFVIELVAEDDGSKQIAYFTFTQYRMKASVSSYVADVCLIYKPRDSQLEWLSEFEDALLCTCFTCSLLFIAKSISVKQLLF
jgi:hypothetical protein